MPAQRAAGLRLLEVYADLAQRGQNLLGNLLAGQAPIQWSHYPEEDAVDAANGYQWFYHSHAPQDRPATLEHGHIHLFARRALWARRLRSNSEKSFSRLCGRPRVDPATRHLLAIGFDAKGVPKTLFTVNSWVTGDLMLNAHLTLDLLIRMRLDTGWPQIDAVLESLVKLCGAEISRLLALRDEFLRVHARRGLLADKKLEVLSQVNVDLDAVVREMTA